MASQDNLLLGAQTHIDTVSVGNTQLSAGRKLLMRCGELLSAFTHGAMKLIAQAKVEIQSHADSIELTAVKCIVLTAGEKIILQAPVIQYVAQGAQVDLGGGQITQQSSGGHVIKSAGFDHLGPGDGAPPGVNLPQTDVQHGQQVVLTDMHTAEPLGNRRYRITVEDGQVHEGRTNANGLTGVLKSTLAYARYTIELLD